MHCNSRPPDVEPVVIRCNIILLYNFIRHTGSHSEKKINCDDHNAVHQRIPNVNIIGQCAAELSIDDLASFSRNSGIFRQSVSIYQVFWSNLYRACAETATSEAPEKS